MGKKKEREYIFLGKEQAIFSLQMGSIPKFIDKSVTGNLEHTFSEKQYDRGWGFIGAPMGVCMCPV